MSEKTMAIVENRKKILFIMQLPPPIHGVCVVNKSIYESEAVNSLFNVSLFRLDFSKSFAQMHSGKIRKAILTFVYVVRLIWKILLNRPNLVYFTISPTGSAFYRDAIFVFILKMFRLPILYHLHGKGVASQLKNKIRAYLYTFVFDREYVFHLSPLLYSDIEEFVSHEQCRFIPNGVSSSYTTVEVRTDDVNYDQRKTARILYFANLDKRKGVLDLVDAYSQLLLQGVRAELIIGGSYTAQLSKRQLDEHLSHCRKLGGHVKVLGPVYGKEKEEMFREADIFAYPSCNDAFPLVVLEAMSYGLPVVTTREGAIPDMVEDEFNGLLVPHRDPLSLSVTLGKLISDCGLRQKLGGASLQKYKEKFTAEIFENNFVANLIEVLALVEKNK